MTVDVIPCANSDSSTGLQQLLVGDSELKSDDGDGGGRPDWD